MDVNTAAFNVGHDFKGGARALAVAICKNPNTLNAELGEVGTAKLGLRDSLKMSLYTGDLRIAQAYAAECGLGTYQLPELLEVGEFSDCMHALGVASKNYAVMCAGVCSSMSDDFVTDNELNEAESQMGHLIAAGQAVLAAMTACNLAGKTEPRRRGFTPFTAVSSAATSAAHVGKQSRRAQS